MAAVPKHEKDPKKRVVVNLIAWFLGGMKVKADRDESSPYAAMLAAQDVAQVCKEHGITALHIKLRATGGNNTKTPEPGVQSALRVLARSQMKIGRIGMVYRFVWILIRFIAPLCDIKELYLLCPRSSSRHEHRNVNLLIS
ncbi:hypothetical protein MLD38_015099 [Melastoma candidum]|uniref:Uncharacterized protein n=1 Tax=Melastoma candidum TaxID=119954 RepID=A0ACB9RF08_9MYRT|nr:hypothetical protein MLD38_015099 [Melastoma candidum]